VQSLKCLLTATNFSESLLPSYSFVVHRKQRLTARQTKPEAKNDDAYHTEQCASCRLFERSLFRAKRINHCNDFVARVALEVVDSSWWKQQLRAKSAGSGTASLSLNKEGIAVVIAQCHAVLVPTAHRVARAGPGSRHGVI
jgi:hypothetical protein